MLASGLGVGVNHGEFCKVDHVGGDVHKGAKDDGPCSSFVEGDVLIEGNVVVQRGTTQERDEIAADGQKNKYNVDMEDEGSGTGDG